ncbi:MAG: ATP-binding cassette domain-containing protein, partial [Betaproteobacteria bacterium]|nr:ATP-binding cassette domain-containing protein [Betaproteobacteria bacterium]
MAARPSPQQRRGWDLHRVWASQAVHAWYGSSHIVHGIDLTISRGQTLALLGRNGMGKSTLIRCLLGHVSQREGRVLLFGQDVSKRPPHEIARRG